MLIRIELPRNRDFCGCLLVLDDAGKIAFGPEWCAGRANDAAALRRGNDSRSCLLPYGDTPLGHYRLRQIISMREASDHALKQFGRFGIVSLGATGGQALMAALDPLVSMPARRRIVVGGEMLELGASGEQLHRECGRNSHDRSCASGPPRD